MIRKVPLYKILSAIHVVFFTSMLCFGITFLTGSLLALPAFGAAFLIGKDWLYDELDITNSIVRSYFSYFKRMWRLMRFFPIGLLLLLNMVGIWAASKMNLLPYTVVCMAILSILCTIMLYIVGYAVFVAEDFKIYDVILAMFVKPLSIATIFLIMLLAVYFFSGTLAIILFFMGTFFLFVIEVVIFITMLYYLKLTQQLDENEKFAYLVQREDKKEK